MRPSNNLKNKIPLDILKSSASICLKVQVYSFLEPPVEYNQAQILLTNQG